MPERETDQLEEGKDTFMSTPEITVDKPVAFVTGAGGGIGRATALRLASTHSLIITDLSEATLDETATAIDGVGGVSHAVPADITDFAQLDDALRQGERRFGTISAAVACAGIEVMGTAETVPLDAWQLSLAVNLTGVFLTARAALPSLKATRGSFTAIASDAATEGCEDGIAYTAAKHGVLGIIRCLALDHGPSGVRSNAICPGFVDTKMTARIFAGSPDGSANYYQDLVPLGRFAQAAEVAEVVRHFVDSTYSNGTIYALDGGATSGYFGRPGT